MTQLYDKITVYAEHSNATPHKRCQNVLLHRYDRFKTVSSTPK